LKVVEGASGVGKTSLLVSGVVHDLREQLSRKPGSVGGKTPFAVAVFRGWRDDPLFGLMEAIRMSVESASNGRELDPWRPGEPVVETLRAWTEQARRLLVV